MTSTNNNFSNLINTAYDAEENLELLKGTTKADLFQENLDLKKALNFMKNTLEEKQSKPSILYCFFNMTGSSDPSAR